jgi:hypothetical protein
MNRRDALKLFATLPAVGLFTPKETEAAEKPLGPFVRPTAPAILQPNYAAEDPNKDGLLQSIEGPIEPEKMAELLWANYCKKEKEWADLRREHDRMGVREIEARKRVETLTHAALMRFCLRLNDWSLSAPFQPSVPPPNVRFDVMPESACWVVTPDKERHWVAKASSRKLRTVFNMACMEDLAAFHGLDAHVEVVAILSEQAALEVQMECRKNQPAVYALHLPPMVPLDIPRSQPEPLPLYLGYAKVL